MQQTVAAVALAGLGIAAALTMDPTPAAPRTSTPHRARGTPRQEPAQGGPRVVRAGPDLGLPFSPAIRAGRTIYVAGMIATDAGGTFAGGDVRAQTRRVLDTIRATVEAAGSSLAQATSVHVYFKRRDDFAAMNEVYRTYFPDSPPARTTIVTDLILPDALVEVSMTVAAAGADRTVIRPEGWQASPNPYSYAIRSGDTLFLSGLVARHPRDNTIVDGDVTVQTKAALANASSLLAAAGMSLSDVVSARVYLADAADFQAMNAAYRGAFADAPPARATVVAGLTRPEFKVELTFTAVQGPKQAILPPNADGTPGTRNPNLSAAIRAGDRLFVSGMLGVTDATRGDMKAQARETLARIGRTLEAAGFAWPDVADVLVYVTDLTRFAAMNEAYREIFARDFPARATVRAGLVNQDGLVEIMMTADK